MRRRRTSLCLGLALILLVPVSTYAQGETRDTLAESVFWDRLRQTDLLLDKALAQPDPGAAVAQIHLWDGIKKVQLNNGVIEIDMRWLTQALGSGKIESLREAQRELRALLNYHDHLGGQGTGLPTGTLAEILKDPRFQYAETTPTPIPTAEPNPNAQPSPSSGLSVEISQLLLAVLGILVVMVGLIYVARMVRTQGIKLPLPDNPTDDPTTSGNALDMASDRAASRDYRTAIRYLYLSSLLMLDERGLIHYDSTLTNREHLRQIDAKSKLLPVLRPVVAAFEDVWYGYAPVDEAFYQRYYQNIQQLRQYIP